MAGYYMGIPSPTTIVATLTIFLALDVIAVLLRFGARLKSKQPIQIDDWLTIPCLILNTGLSTVMFYGVSIKSLGYPISALTEIDQSRGIPTRKLEYASINMAPVALGLLKCCVLLFYRRIFVVDKFNRWDRRNLFFSFATLIIILWATAIFLVTLFLCRTNWDYLWGDSQPPPGYCADGFQMAWVFSLTDFMTDALVIMIPLPFVWMLHLTPARKFAVVGIFSLGLLTTIVSFLRLLWVKWNEKVGYDPSLDEALMVTWGCYWYAVEATIGLIAACLPTLGVFFKGMVVPKSVRSFFASFSPQTLFKEEDPNSKLGMEGPAIFKIDSGSGQSRQTE